MISFVTRNFQTHGVNLSPIPCCQPLINYERVPANCQQQPQQHRHIFNKPAPEFKFNHSKCPYDEPAVKTVRKTANKTLYAEEKPIQEILPCSFGEWIILSLLREANKPITLTAQQVEAIIKLKQGRKNLDEHDLIRFFTIVNTATGKTAMQAKTSPTHLQQLKNNLFYVYKNNALTATQLIKIAIQRNQFLVEPVENKHFLSQLKEIKEQPQKPNFLSHLKEFKEQPLTNFNKQLNLENYHRKNPTDKTEDAHVESIREMYEIYDENFEKISKRNCFKRKSMNISTRKTNMKQYKEFNVPKTNHRKYKKNKEQLKDITEVIKVESMIWPHSAISTPPIGVKTNKLRLSGKKLPVFVEPVVKPVPIKTERRKVETYRQRDSVGKITQMLSLQAKEDELSKIAPGRIIKLFRNIEKNPKVVNPMEYKVLQSYANKVMAQQSASYNPEYLRDRSYSVPNLLKHLDVPVEQPTVSQLEKKPSNLPITSTIARTRRKRRAVKILRFYK